jgi:hypothetical protein
MKRRAAYLIYQLAIDHLAAAPETGSSDIVNVVHRVLESVHGYKSMARGR